MAQKYNHCLVVCISIQFHYIHCSLLQSIVHFFRPPSRCPRPRLRPRRDDAAASVLNLTAHSSQLVSHGSQGPEGTLAVVPDDRLDAGVLGERILAELASDPALLETPKGDI